MSKRLGELWIALGIFHLVLIGVLAAAPLADIVAAGGWNGVGDSPERGEAFWLFYLGIPFVLLGIITRWAQRQVGTVPQSLGWATVLGGLFGLVLVPASGFVLVVALGVYTVVVARRSAAGPVRPVPVGG